LSRWRILELELPVEAGSSIVTRVHGCETAEREAGFAVSVEMTELEAIHIDQYIIIEKGTDRYPEVVAHATCEQKRAAAGLGLDQWLRKLRWPNRS
jgi:hypothetical protein